LEQLSERIASVSFPTVLLALLWLTIVRGAFYASRNRLFHLAGDALEPLILAIGLVFLILRPFLVQTFFIPSASMRPTLWEGDHIVVNKWVYRNQSPERGEVVVFRAPPDVASDEKEFIKRVIGLPGDQIAIHEGFVSVGGLIYTCNEIRSVLGEDLSAMEYSGNGNLPPLRLTTEAIWLDGKRIAPEDFAVAAKKPGKTVVIHPGRVVRSGETLMETYIAEDPQYRVTEVVIPPGHYFVLGDNRNQSNDSHNWGMLPADRLIGRAEAIFWPFNHAKRIR